MWMRRGRQVEVPSPGQNQKVYAFGGVDFATGELLTHVPNLPKGGKNSAQFLIWFGKLVERARRRRKRVILVIDNGPIHTAKRVRAVLEDPAIRKLVHVIWLPKYAPDLNDQERVWRYAKEHGIANVLFAGKDSLREQVLRVFAALNRNRAARMMIVLGHRYRRARTHKDLLMGT
jgi:transposase